MSSIAHRASIPVLLIALAEGEEERRMTKGTKKLALKTETLRLLTESEMARAAGGQDLKTTLSLFCPTNQGTCYCPPPHYD
jgi:hypothetical protein